MSIASGPAIEHFTTPRGGGASMLVRPGTNDHNVLVSCMDEDEYGLRDLDLRGIAVDVGAHIGGVTVALALDFPRARVIAIEALSENVELLQANVDRHGVQRRVTVLHRAASATDKGTALVEWDFPSEAGQHHRYVGDAKGMGLEAGRHEEVRRVSLFEVAKMAGGRIDFLKIDCEGCEYSFLSSPAIGQVEVIVGEWHHGPERIHGLLDRTHEVSTEGDAEVGMFRAVRR